MQTAPVAISDRMPVREFQQLELLRPHLAHARARHDDVLGVSADGQLNPREIEIMRRVACGASNAEVARRLWLSQHTVRKHLENIYAKLGVQSRTAALNALGNMRDERRHPTFQ
jgi:DNA-binding CsgD family transcriptional regulator